MLHGVYVWPINAEPPVLMRRATLRSSTGTAGLSRVARLGQIFQFPIWQPCLQRVSSKKKGGICPNLATPGLSKRKVEPDICVRTVATTPKTPSRPIRSGRFFSSVNIRPMVNCCFSVTRVGRITLSNVCNMFYIYLSTSS